MPVVLLVEHPTGDVVAIRFHSEQDADRWCDAHPGVEAGDGRLLRSAVAGSGSVVSVLERREPSGDRKSVRHAA